MLDFIEVKSRQKLMKASVIADQFSVLSVPCLTATFMIDARIIVYLFRRRYSSTQSV